MTLNMTIEFSGALHHGSGYGILGLVDRAVQRRQDGEYVLGASALKGRFRHAALQVLQARAEQLCWPGAACPRGECLLCSVFGSARRRGDAIFSDAVVSEPERSWLKELRSVRGDAGLPMDSGVRAHTAVDRRRKVVRGQHLYSSETVSGGLRFSTTIRGLRNQRQVSLLQDCGRLLTTFGGDSARGLGFCTFELASEQEGAEE